MFAASTSHRIAFRALGLSLSLVTVLSAFALTAIDARGQDKTTEGMDLALQRQGSRRLDAQDHRLRAGR